jgi:hypothetical protein
MFKKEKRVTQKTVKIKPSVYNLAVQLTEINLPFSEGSINDYLEKVIVTEAAYYGLLPAEELSLLQKSQGLVDRKPEPTNEPVVKKEPAAPRSQAGTGLPLGRLS